MPLRPIARTNFRKPKRILIVDDSKHILEGVESVRQHLLERRHDVHTAASFGEAKQKIHSLKPDMVFSDFQLSKDSGAPTGLHLAKEARAANPGSEFRIHSMAAKEIRAERELLERMGLRPRDIYEKRQLGRLLGLKAQHGIHFMPDTVEKLVEMQRHHNVALLSYGGPGAAEAERAGFKRANMVNVSEALTGIMRRKPENVLIVAKNQSVAKALQKTLNVVNIWSRPVSSMSEAAKQAGKGTLIVVAPDAIEAGGRGAEAHDAGHILRRMKQQ